MINNRRLEKTNLCGFLIYIRYKGVDYYSFDENKDKKTIKGEMKEILKKENIYISKGIQQAGRTDRNVSADENILYITCKNSNIDILNKYSNIIHIEKTIPFLDLPELIEKRHYIFSYPLEKIKNSRETIEKLCKALSDLEDFSEFTTKKGKLLKNQNRKIKIEYIDNELHFIGDSFLPHQVRIMSSYILNNSKKELDGKYLRLHKIYIKDELKDLILTKTFLNIENEVYSEVCKNYTIIYSKDKSKTIGKNAKNLKKLNIINKVIVKDYVNP